MLVLDRWVLGADEQDVFRARHGCDVIRRKLKFRAEGIEVVSMQECGAVRFVDFAFDLVIGSWSCNFLLPGRWASVNPTSIAHQSCS